MGCSSHCWGAWSDPLCKDEKKIQSAWRVPPFCSDRPWLRIQQPDPGAGVSDLSCQLVWLTGVSDTYNKFFVESFARSFGGRTTLKAAAKSGPAAATGSLLAYRDLLRNLSRLLSASRRGICFECTGLDVNLISFRSH